MFPQKSDGSLSRWANRAYAYAVCGTITRDEHTSNRAVKHFLVTLVVSRSLMAALPMHCSPSSDRTSSDEIAQRFAGFFFRVLATEPEKVLLAAC